MKTSFKKAKLSSVLFSFLMLSWAVSAQATTWSASNDPSLYGYLNQYTIPTIGPMACGPASAVNSFVFLQNTYSSVYGTNLVPDSNSNGVIDNADMVAVAQILAGPTYMDTTLADGTGWSYFGPAIQNYIESKDPGVTVYNSSYLAGSTEAWNFIYQQLNSGSDLEILLQSTSSTSGINHFITPYALTWDDQTLSGTLSWVDPLDATQHTASMLYDSVDAHIELAAYGWSWIYAGASERPAACPELSSLLLLGSGLLSLFGFKRKFI